jgi:hypothetical protein
MPVKYATSSLSLSQESDALRGFFVSQDDRLGLKGTPIVKKQRNFGDMGAMVVKSHYLAIVDELKNLFHNILLPVGGIIPAAVEVDYSKTTVLKSMIKCMDSFGLPIEEANRKPTEGERPGGDLAGGIRVWWSVSRAPG